ncbi:hypothetical protein E0493_18585 [Roseomonas sp. M0104]|uniref:Uncharacterized protein n=1 Tax=Teichococcus coralli TaxID=2545983 RepID=A0A845BPM4_9PROT|nr:hypothetical protein [Pseudoroseomonas coralli]MXP65359.1 hypothetical protein [Pseudoroseomonas coralli]
MRIRRLRLVLPARLAPTATQDARRIAEAAGAALAGAEAPPGRIAVTLPGLGRPAAALAADAGGRLGAAAAGKEKGKGKGRP